MLRRLARTWGSPAFFGRHQLLPNKFDSGPSVRGIHCSNAGRAGHPYVNTFTQILAGELPGTGVQVQALRPGVIATEFHEQVGTTTNAFPAAFVMSPEAVVQASLRGLALGEMV